MSFDYYVEKGMREFFHLLTMGRNDKALQRVDKLLAECPNSELLLFFRALALCQMERYDEAFESCNQALSNGHSPSECNDLLARIYYQKGRLAEAEASILEALRLSPQNADYFAFYGQILMRSGHEKRAQKTFQIALKIDPQNAIAARGLYSLSTVRDTQAEQEKAFYKSLESADGELQRLVNMASFEAKRGNYKEAFEHYRQAFLFEPTSNHLLKVMQNMEKSAHPMFLPQRIIDKLGGPPIFWLMTIAISFILRFLNLNAVAAVFISAYIILFLYTMITPAIYRLIYKH